MNRRVIRNKIIILYSILSLSFVMFVFSITYTYLQNNLREMGKSYVINNYYDIVMQNVMIDYDTTSIVKLDNTNNTISIKINDLKNYSKENSINLELYNIGNIDSVINDILITNINSSIDSEKVIIKLSLEKEETISSSEKKVLKIIIKCDENTVLENDYYNFDINLSYKEVVR